MCLSVFAVVAILGAPRDAAQKSPDWTAIYLRNRAGHKAGTGGAVAAPKPAGFPRSLSDPLNIPKTHVTTLLPDQDDDADPVILYDLAANEDIHVSVDEAGPDDQVTTRIAANDQDTELLFQGRVIATIPDQTNVPDAQVTFTSQRIRTVEEPTIVRDNRPTPEFDFARPRLSPRADTPRAAIPALPPEEDTLDEHGATFIWSGQSRGAFKPNLVVVENYRPGLDSLQAQVRYGHEDPRIDITDSETGDAVICINGQPTFKLIQTPSAQVDTGDLRISAA